MIFLYSIIYSLQGLIIGCFVYVVLSKKEPSWRSYVDADKKSMLVASVLLWPLVVIIGVILFVTKFIVICVTRMGDQVLSILMKYDGSQNK